MGALTRIAGLAVLAVLGLVAAGCGGGSPSAGVANLGTTSATTTTSGAGSQLTPKSKLDAAFAFSKCMRANGYPTFPDPQTSGHGISIGPGSGIDAKSPKFQKAQEKCRKVLPNGGQPTPQEIAKVRQQALAYSACMRSHGVPNFPDPQVSTNGGIGIRIGGPGLDPSSPAFQKAQQACAKILPGLVQSKAGAGSHSGGAPSTSGNTRTP